MIIDSTSNSGFFARLLRCSGAAAAAEMALVFPIVGYIFLNVFDFGVYTYSKMQTELAATSAVDTARGDCSTSAQLPATNPTGHCDANLVSKITAAAQSTTLGSSVTLGVLNEAWYCATATGTLTHVAAITAAPPSDCSATVSGSTSAPGDYVSITASFTYTPIFPGVTIASALGTSIQKTAWMRLQ